MNTYKKTAKDLAHDRELARLKKQIKELREEIRQYIIEIKAKEAIVEHGEQLLEEAAAEIESLKKLIEIPKEQLEVFLKDEREQAERERANTSALNALIKLRQITMFSERRSGHEL